MIPQITNAIIETIETVAYPSRTYRLGEEQVAGFVDGLEAIKQAVFHILSTERYAYPIYGDNYGVELEKYKGRGFDYLKATIENTLKDALLQDDRIIDVTVTDVQKIKKDSVLVKFTVMSNRGTFSAGVEINV